jgi:hypothetical protein
MEATASMLAYVFWHWPRADVPAASYEGMQRRFHAALHDAPPDGFIGSRSLAIAGAPWTSGAAGEAYEDWYLLEGAAALDPLNEAAMSAPRRGPHDAAAAAAEGGTAGLYRLRQGAADDPPLAGGYVGDTAVSGSGTRWAILLPILPAVGAAPCGRQMTLGPTPEFCLHTRHPVALPASFFPVTMRCRPVWP